MTITFLQWNVFYKENPDNIVELFKQHDPDVVCAQELIQNSHVTPPDTAEYIAHKTGYHYFYQPADTWSGREDKESQGNAIFSKYPIVATRFEYVQPLHHNPPDAAHEGRVYVEADVEIEGQLITFGTTHLSYTPWFEMTDARKVEVDNLIPLLEQKSSKYIFGADLNSPPDFYAVERIMSLPHLQHAGPDFNEKTWTTKPFDKNGFVENDLNWRLDYVFASKDIEVVRSEIVKTEYSDHLPVLVEVRV